MRMSLRSTLLLRALASYPFPPNPFCSKDVSVQTVQEVLEEAGYKDFRLYVGPNGIVILPTKEN